MVTYSTLSIYHLSLSLPLCIQLPVFLRIVLWNTHRITFFLHGNPPCGYRSLFKDVCLTAVRGHSCLPWLQTCGVDLGLYLRFLFRFYPHTWVGSRWKRPTRLLTCLLISLSPPGLTDLLYSPSLQRDIYYNGDWERYRKYRNWLWKNKKGKDLKSEGCEEGRWYLS